jgi:hypothetical protein
MISAILSCVIFSFTLFNDYESSFFQHMWLFYRGHARFVVFTVVLLKIQIFWDGDAVSLALQHSVISQKVSVFIYKHSQLCNNLQVMKDHKSGNIIAK